MKFKLIVGFSYLGSVVLIGAALFSTPYMLQSLHGETVESPVEMIASYLMFAFFCGLPWLLIYKLPENKNICKIFFSVTSVLLAALFYKPIANGQDFSIGLNIIFYAISIAILFPVSKAIK